MVNNKQERAQAKVRRILLLIDVLAPLRHWQTTDDVHAKIVERSGQAMCVRTTQRDLELLASMGLVDQTRGARFDKGCLRWRLLIDRSWSLQRAALVLYPESENLGEGLPRMNLSAHMKQMLRDIQQHANPYHGKLGNYERGRATKTLAALRRRALVQTVDGAVTLTAGGCKAIGVEEPAE